MKHASIFVALAAGTLAAACEPQPPADQPIPNAEQDILGQERMSLDSWATGNKLGFAHAVAPDVTYLNHEGDGERIEGADAFRAFLITLEVPPHSYELADPKVQLYGDIGILTYHWIMPGPEGELPARWKVTSVYRHIDGEWRMVHAHWSPISGVPTE